MTTQPLDPRPARTDLTDRECTKIIGGLLAPLVQRAGSECIRPAVGTVCRLLRGEPLDWEAASDREEEAAVLVGALATALVGMAAPGAVLVALLWWYEQDEAWKMLDRLPPIGERRERN